MHHLDMQTVTGIMIGLRPGKLGIYDQYFFSIDTRQRLNTTRFARPSLGMDQPITRRDFLNGVAIGLGALLPLADALPAGSSGGAQDAPGYYPPLLTGLRGSHAGSFEAAHALRDGQNWPPPTDTGEEYDLIVVGAGISGLAAAHFYRTRTSP